MFAFRLATPDDADEIARIVSLTSAGVVETLLDGLIAGLQGKTILSTGFIQGEGAYCTDNVILSEQDGNITGLLFAYPSAEHKVPLLMESFVPSKRLKKVRVVLENAIPDSLYINTLWLEQSMRGKGLGDALMVEAAARCRQLGVNRMSLFCWNDNETALRFYSRHNFTVARHISREELPVDPHMSGGSILCKHLNGE